MDEDAARTIRSLLATLSDPLTLLAGLFAHAPVAFQVYKADGHCLLVNQAFRDLFASEPPPEYNVLEDDVAERQGILPLIRRAFAGETIHVPTTWYDPRELKQIDVREGRRVAVQATFIPLHDAAGAVAHVAIAFKDVTVETERQELLEAIVNQSGDGIIVADREGVLRMVNPAAAEQHGHGTVGIAATDWSRTFGLRALDGRELPLADTPLYRALQGERVVDARWRVRRPDGEERILSGTAAPLRHADGSSAGAVITTRDETERLRLEESLRRTNDERERLMGVLGHDLRGPLSAIAMAAGMLLRDPLSPRQHELVAQVVRSVARMQRMISDLLDFTRLRAGARLPLQRTVVRLREILEEIVAEARVANPDRVIELDATDEGEAEVDADRVAQAAANLLGNALEHGDAAQPVTLALGYDGERVRFSVHNAGTPIGDDLRPHLFEPFTRGSDTGGSGVGLGLFIVRQIVDGHGGTIAVTSDVDSGTTFTIELPRRPSR